MPLLAASFMYENVPAQGDYRSKGGSPSVGDLKTNNLCGRERSTA